MNGNFIDTKTRGAFSFWYVNYHSTKKEEYDKSVKLLCSFSDVKDFWRYFIYLKKPSAIPHGGQLSLFKENIKPIWEDKENVGGGRFLLTVNTRTADCIWDELVYLTISTHNDFFDQINGIMATTLNHIVKITIWAKAQSGTGFVEKGVELFHHMTGCSSIDFRDNNNSEK